MFAEDTPHGLALGPWAAAGTLDNDKEPASQHPTLSVMLCHFQRGCDKLLLAF